MTWIKTIQEDEATGIIKKIYASRGSVLYLPKTKNAERALILIEERKWKNGPEPSAPDPSPDPGPSPDPDGGDRGDFGNGTSPV